MVVISKNNFSFWETDWTCLSFFILLKQWFFEKSVLRNFLKFTAKWKCQNSETGLFLWTVTKFSRTAFLQNSNGRRSRILFGNSWRYSKTIVQIWKDFKYLIYRIGTKNSTTRLGISMRHLKLPELSKCPVSLLEELRYLSLANVHKKTDYINTNY